MELGELEFICNSCGVRYSSGGTLGMGEGEKKGQNKGQAMARCWARGQRETTRS